MIWEAAGCSSYKPKVSILQTISALCKPESSILSYLSQVKSEARAELGASGGVCSRQLSAIAYGPGSLRERWNGVVVVMRFAQR